MSDRVPSRATAGWIVPIALLVVLVGLVILPGGAAPSPSRSTAPSSEEVTASAGSPGTPIHTALAVGSSRVSADAAPAATPWPAVITANSGFLGTYYRASCGACVLPDPAIAVGSGYIVELTNGSERVFLTNGSEVVNTTLDAFFGAGSDLLESPAIEFDSGALRWFASSDDLTARVVTIGVSASSDPTGAWNLREFSVGNGVLPHQDRLAVDRSDVVITVSASLASGSYRGAEIWALNKTDLLDDLAVPATEVGTPNPSTQAMVPATPLSDGSSILLVDDVPSAGVLQAYSESGSPPAAPTLTGPVNFTTSFAAPPNATEPGTSNLLGTGNGEVVSAVARGGALWAAATQGCTPAGDSAVRSCLHLWEISTDLSALEQDFLWSSGPGTYDFAPAVSLSTRGDLVVAFGESSAALYPSIFATGQSITGPASSLIAPIVLHDGMSPIDPATGCPGGVCPFGTDFGIAFNPLTYSHFYSVGEFVGRNSTTTDWKTWINQITALPTFPVTFTEANLPNGTSWSVTVNGAEVASTGPSIEIDEPNGSYTFVVESPINGSSGIRYLPAPASGTFAVNDTPATIPLTYALQYEVSAVVTPAGAGTVFPDVEWFYANSTVSLSALAAPGYRFEAWNGSGPGSYSGGENPANLTVTAPIEESAEFWASVTYAVSFTESGLPAGTNWTVTLDGVANGSSGPSIGFNEPNGSYSFVSESPVPEGPQTEYVPSPAAGSFVLSGAGNSASITYRAEFELEAAPATTGMGTVNPSGGWFLAGSTLNLSALAAPGELFARWNGSGPGSYSGVANPAPVTMDGPVTETAEFAQSVTYSVTYTESGLPAGARWTVTTNGLVSSVTGAALTFNVPNGTYTFAISSSFVDPNGTVYVADPGFGSFAVGGQPVTENITFHPVAAAASAPTKGSGPSPGSSAGAWLLGIALAGLFVFAIALTVSIWRKNPPPVPPVVIPPPPPIWDETSV